MVAYSFKQRFAAPILAGTKRQTIRADRKRHARPGEELQHYTGMRTKHCRLIGRAICEALLTILINLEADYVVVRRFDHEELFEGAALDEFARDDGFEDWADMKAFWRAEHGTIDRFEGVLVKWGDLL